MISWLLQKIDALIGDYLPFQLIFRRVPANVLLHIKPGTSVSRMKHVLKDAPYAIADGYYTYKFKNLYLQVRSADDRTIDAVTAVLPKLKVWTKFKIPYLTRQKGWRLGSIEMDDVLDMDTQIQRDTGSKHGRVWAECYFGRPGGYFYYTFGLFEGPAVKYSDELPFVNEKGEVVDGDLNGATVNYVTVAQKSGVGGTFDFWAME